MNPEEELNKDPLDPMEQNKPLEQPEPISQPSSLNIWDQNRLDLSLVERNCKK